MSDVLPGSEHPLYGTFANLCAVTRADEAGQIIGTISADSGQGSSYVARELALLAAGYYGPLGHRVALIDLDFSKQSQSVALMQPAMQSRYGCIDGPFDATLGDATYGHGGFWQVNPANIETPRHHSDYCGLFLLGDTGLAFTQFQWAHVEEGQSVYVRNAREYWHALRHNFALTVLDIPATDRSQALDILVAEIDQTVIISEADRAQDVSNGALVTRITDAGGKCSGMILNRRPRESRKVAM